MFDLSQIQRKLTILNNYDVVFRSGFARQELPKCCGKTYDLGDLLKMEANLISVDVEGVPVSMFEVVCPTCGRTVPPEWRIEK